MEKAGDGQEKILVSVTNEGGRDGDAVVQVYAECDSPFAPLHPRLCGFRRILVPAGASLKVSVPMDGMARTVVNDEGVRIEGSGSWTLYAGFGGPDRRTRELTGVSALSVPIRG